MEENERPVGVLLATTAALYFTFAVLPAGGLLLTSGGWLWQRETLSSTQHFTPVADGLGVMALVGVGLTALFAVVPALVLGVRRLPRDLRKGVGIGLIAAHVLLVVVSVGTTATVGVLPVLLDREHFVMRVKEPSGARAALLYQDRGECRWSVYVSEPLDPVATQHTTVRCRCDDMRKAEVVWRGPDPQLVDPRGQPFSCPAPPTGCSTTHRPMGGLFLLLLALVGTRRFRESCPAGQ